MRKFLFLTFLLLGLSLLSSDVPAADYPPDHSSPFVYKKNSKKISMDFQEASLVYVLKIFSQQTNLNLITAESLATKKVTIFLENVPVDEALTQLLKANNLTYEIRPETNIYIVKPLTTPDEELMTRVYLLKHATVSEAKIKKTLAISRADNETIKTEVEPGKTGITAVITAILTEKGKVIEDPRTNSLIIGDIATNFPRIEQTINRLDVPIPQVLIEVEMLEVSKGTSEKIGVKFGDTPLAFTGATRQTLLPWDTNNLIRKGFTWEGSEYTAGLIDASGLTATLQLLRSQTDTKNLARPRILTLSNETAQIKITTNEAIGVSTQTNSSQSNSTQSVEAERVETGVVLTVTPQADLQTNEITMAILPRVVQARTGATFNGVTYRDPEERGSQSILRVKSGETIVIGGLLRDDVTNTSTKVPILGDIPLVGQAFRHKDKSNSERELIIFITPHILNANEDTQVTQAPPENLTREQDIPGQKSNAINNALSHYEKKK